MKISKLKNYFFNLILIWLAFLIYTNLSYYKNFLMKQTITILLILAVSYTILGFIFHMISKKQKQTKGNLVFSAISKIPTKNKINPEEKNAILFSLVKFFFLPIMINFFLSNFRSISIQISRIDFSIFSIQGFNTLLFPFLLAGIFMFDTLWFAFGYAFESGFLKNKLISVEPTFFGWFVALICYPPFNSALTNITNWYANDYAIFSSTTITFIIRLLIIFFLLIYLSATFALGTKCSNLTNRGIISRGPYRFIRHPAYISKNLAWWLTIIPIISLPAVASMAVWSTIYHLRSITEERHLSKDPNYINYKNKVQYKYIPGVY